MGQTTTTRVLGVGDAALEVSTIGYGCMGLDSAWDKPMDADDATTLLRQAHERGVAFFDTAEAYGQGRNETLVERAPEPIRDQVVIATKFGFVDGRPPTGSDSRPERIREVAEAALSRLRTDRIDLCYQHRVDPNVPIEEVAGTVRVLIAEGKVRHFGLSEAGAAQVALAWLLAQSTSLVPIPGTTKLHRIEENLGATEITLTPEDLDALDRAAAAIEIAGDVTVERIG